MYMKKVEIYSTPSCHFCHLAKEYFTEKGVVYTEYNVASDAEKRKEMVSMTGQMGVPVIRIGDQIAVGFQQSIIDQMLAA